MIQYNNAYPAGYYPQQAYPNTYQPMMTPMTPYPAYGGDAYAVKSVGTEDTGNKQASTLKKIGNSVARAFSKVADFVGLGTASHFAKDAFKTYDGNKDNHLDVNEFYPVSQLLGTQFQPIDANADQKVSFGEFKRLVGDLLDAEMRLTDTSGDGFVNYNEAYARGYVGFQGNQNAFTVADKNQDNLLSFGEFAALANSRKFNKPI